MRNPQLKGFLTFPAFAKDEDWYVFVFLVDDFEGELIDLPEGDLNGLIIPTCFSLNLWEGMRSFCPGWTGGVLSPASSSTRMEATNP